MTPLPNPFESLTATLTGSVVTAGIPPTPEPLPVAANPAAKATKGKTGTAGVIGPVRRSTTGTGLRVGETDADRSTTSEFMGVTAGETATNSDPLHGSIPPAAETSGSAAFAEPPFSFPDIPEPFKRGPDNSAPFMSARVAAASEIQGSIDV